MKLSPVAALAACVLAMALGACVPGPRGGASSVVAPGDSEEGVELSSKDIVTMARKMTESIARCPHIVGSKKLPVTLVMTAIANETRTIKYLNRITLAKIRVELNRHLPRGKILFVMELWEHDAVRRREGRLVPDPLGGRRIQPDYVLKGRFLDHPTKRGIYYLCTFQVVHLESGAIVWEDSYEVKRVGR